jgi:thioredoxin-related protein
MKKILLFTIVILFINVSLVEAQSKKATKKMLKKEAKKAQNANENKVETTIDNSPLFWHTNVFKADSISKISNKPIFGFFTGSDWCGWCHRLQAKVFAKPDFIKWAKEKVVLLELDFPRNNQQTPEIQQQNAGLQQAFKVEGYPTIWIFKIAKDSATNSMKLNPLGSLGYPNASAGKEEATFLTSANEILNKEK